MSATASTKLANIVRVINMRIISPSFRPWELDRQRRECTNLSYSCQYSAGGRFSGTKRGEGL
jgi:hypothetical protein